MIAVRPAAAVVEEEEDRIAIDTTAAGHRAERIARREEIWSRETCGRSVRVGAVQDVRGILIDLDSFCATSEGERRRIRRRSKHQCDDCAANQVSSCFHESALPFPGMRDLDARSVPDTDLQ